ncbi:di-trans,poly-cis-decaprenylcistransferase [Buchnera aphidicola (Muscaphis stroyani)]|uniref:Ditrans,polycis-undecaprenyl-diphosphate synthase ((2E,6E)-farnesyl-diphosphate specific) n=1 Tax=Buchnera aphidicola (Muscaphis stroyani) TaxID=1241869 RepID=A0A4D6YFC8_9GAMM|nr:polyprenyl diphosphate synthase [Buchnera aphidicola]QCI24320.1 di-trans,poly-cis-decaprenylcistransferase [Buchnera aphidicola (Muscaphis stroyani)]
MLNIPSLKNKKCLIGKNPHHVAVIMDGNGRWAEKKGKMRVVGHQEGLKAVKKVVKFAFIKKLKILTLYAFSSENWKRSELEIKALIKLFLFALNSEIHNLTKYNIRLKIIGNLKHFNKDFQHCVQKAEEITLKNSGLLLNIAINYGGRWDIIQGIKKIFNRIQQKKLKLEKINENMFSQYLSTGNSLPVDLVIRTGGEKRISNFLLWQIAYSELYFTDVLWPDFNQYIFQDAINFFISRNRRFGG